jgi:hypothetical protein
MVDLINLGFNHYGESRVATRDKFESHYRRTKPHAVVLIDDPNWAIHLKTNVIPGSIVIPRKTYGSSGGRARDNDLPQLMSPQAWVNDNLWMAEYDLTAYMGNELAITDENIAWVEKATDLADAAGLGVCIFNVAVGNPADREWGWMKLDWLVLRAQVQKKTYLSIHEYGLWTVQSGGLEHVDRVTVDGPPVHLIGRSYDALREGRKAREVYGYDWPKLIVTEWGWDVINGEGGGLHVAKTQWPVDVPTEVEFVRQWADVRERVYWHPAYHGVCYYTAADGKE